MVLINFFTFNMGGTHDENWETIFKSFEWQNLFRKYGIWVVCTQEDSRESKFMKALISVVFKGYKWATKTPRHVYLRNFHVHLSVFVPFKIGLQIQDSLYHPSYRAEYKHSNSFLRKFIINIKSEFKNKFYHKSSVVIDIGRNIRIVGSHFPFNPKDESNASMREEALEQIISLSQGKTMFILGDLNFRNVVSDQLLSFILKKNTVNIVDITSQIQPTCKTCTDKKLNKKVELDNTVSFDSDNIKRETDDITEEAVEGQEIGKECYVTKFKKGTSIVYRSPSKCDRILMVNNEEYRNYGAYPVIIDPINYSDHNAVYGWVELDDRVLHGGGTKKKVRILGRERILTREGRKYMLTYKKKRISLAEARKLEKELSRVKNG